MARGAKQEQDLLNNQANIQQQQASQIRGMELPVIQNQLQNPGYDPMTAAAIRRSGMDTTNSAFDAAKFSAAQRAGSTGNDAMYYASADKLAQDRSKGLSEAATGAEIDIGKQKLASQQQAIADASQLYSFNNSASTDLYGQGLRAQQGRTDPVKFGWSPQGGLSLGSG